jgi:Raf kinase inhibitor-like YbhB/YbcL family protein
LALNIQDLALTSPDFDHLARLDDRHAFDKGNEPPRLTIAGVPDGTVELAIICHDPDAPLPDGFTHWTLYGIDKHQRELGADADESFRPGDNQFGARGYGGPKPPAGHGIHHYYFWVYALSRPVAGTPSRRAFVYDYADAIIEQNRLIGTYSN